MPKRKPKEYFCPYRKFNGFVIPNVLAESGLLGPGELIVWGRLAQFAGKNGDCYPKHQTIADCTSISERGVIRHINGLVEKGFIEVVPRFTKQSSRKSNRYLFVKHPIFDLEMNSDDHGKSLEKDCVDCPSDNLSLPPSANQTLSLVPSCHNSGDKLAPKEIHEENQKKTTTAFPSEELQNSPRVVVVFLCLILRVERYIDLKVKRTVAEGEVKTTSTRLRNSLVRLAKSGRLDMSDFEELKRWDKRRTLQDENSHCGGNRIQHSKSKLHEELSQKNVKAVAWFTALPCDHRAKLEVKPHNSPENVWIRNKYDEYGVDVE